MKRRTIVAGSLGVLAFPSIVVAQEKFPSRPIRLVVPYPPGGPTDIVGRLVGEKMAQVLGTQIVVDNKAGAAGMVGSNDVAKNSKPDGYTLLVGTSSSHTVGPLTAAKPLFDPVKDFEHIAIVGYNAAAIAASLAMPANLKDFVALQKASPGKYSYGTSGPGGMAHLGGELFKQRAGDLKVEVVHYRGAAPMVQDLLAGNIAWGIDTLSSTLPHHKAGKLRVLCVGLDRRSKAAPDIPTAAEAGVPNYNVYTFNVISAPAGVPKPIVDQLGNAFQTAMKDATLIDKLEQAGVTPTPESGPAHATRTVQAEIDKWGPVVKAAGVVVQ